MSAAAPRLAAVIPIDSRRPAQRLTRPGLKLVAVAALCLLGLVGSFADSALARSGLLMLNAGDTLDGDDLSGIALAVAGAILGNIAVCVGVALLLYWYLSRPTAEILELRPRRLTKR